VGGGGVGVGKPRILNQWIPEQDYSKRFDIPRAEDIKTVCRLGYTNVSLICEPHRFRRKRCLNYHGRLSPEEAIMLFLRNAGAHLTVTVVLER
jgi:hypothetical protein